MDALERLVWHSDLSHAVLGSGEEFVLIRLDVDEDRQATIDDAIRRGYCFAGVLGFQDGQPVVKCDDPSTVMTMMHAALDYAHIIAAHLRQQQGDAVDWLESLHKMPDPR